MATMVQRARAILNALANQEMSDAQLLRVGRAVARNYPNVTQEQIDAATPEELATLVVRAMRREMMRLARGAEEQQAAEAALLARRAQFDVDVPLGND